jgi:hypothetical protein
VDQILIAHLQVGRDCPRADRTILMRSTGVPAGGISVIVPTPRNAGLAFHCDCGVIVPTASKLSCAAWLPTS